MQTASSCFPLNRIAQMGGNPSSQSIFHSGTQGNHHLAHGLRIDFERSKVASGCFEKTTMGLQQPPPFSTACSAPTKPAGLVGYGSKCTHPGTAGFSPSFHFPGLHFGVPIFDPQPFGTEKRPPFGSGPRNEANASWWRCSTVCRKLLGIASPSPGTRCTWHPNLTTIWGEVV